MIDVTSDTWFTVNAFTTGKMADTREELESPTCQPRRDDFLRGYLQALKDIAGLPGADEQPQPLDIGFFDEEK